MAHRVSARCLLPDANGLASWQTPTAEDPYRHWCNRQSRFVDRHNDPWYQCKFKLGQYQWPSWHRCIQSGYQAEVYQRRGWYPGINFTNPGSGTADWIAGNYGATTGDRVVMGNLLAKQTIGAHNNTPNCLGHPLILNQGGGNVAIGTASANGQPNYQIL